MAIKVVTIKEINTASLKYSLTLFFLGNLLFIETPSIVFTFLLPNSTDTNTVAITTKNIEIIK